jgi:hypothetical protein
MDRFIRFEHKREPIASGTHFLSRLGRNAAFALAVIVASLAIGIAGYMGLEGLDFIDAFLNAAMILSTMGPVAPLHNDGAKIFASFYAIASGLLLFAIAGLLLAPVYHRMMHRFHLEEEGEDERRRDGRPKSGPSEP